MRNIKVVIGSNLGDEAKGLTTDYFAAQIHSSNTKGVVVRFNGGAQAGHTVVTPQGRRHVFGHFGSGTFAGLPTYLSEFFVVNPLLFMKELGTIQMPEHAIRVCVNPDCLVTTPYDMMLNQIAEISRGSNRHGSCGVGFNETIVRSQNPDLKLTYRDLYDRKKAQYIFEVTRTEYVYDRLKELGIDKIPGDFEKYFKSDIILEKYMQDADKMRNIALMNDNSYLDSFDAIVFEGAQGLLLDQGHEWFPHVTRSNTGMQNVRAIIDSLTQDEEESIEICYVTRAYMTRHGAGPFPTEIVNGRPYSGIIDATNVPNEFQGTLRFGIIDLDLLARTIKNDLRYAEGLKYLPSIMVTCLDQVDDKVTFIANGRPLTEDIDTFLSYVWDLCGTIHIYQSYGPTRDTIVGTGIPTPV